MSNNFGLTEDLSVVKKGRICYTVRTMIKTITVAGIPLDNYTVRESLIQVEKDMSDFGFHTIEEVNTEMLMKASGDEALRKALFSMEHTVIAENAILDVMEGGSYQRTHEIAHHDFFFEFMRRMERNQKTIFLLGETMGRVEEMQLFLLNLFPESRIVGVAALEQWEDSLDAMINDINVLSPNVLLSVLPSPLQEHFLMENKNKLSANLWYGIGNPQSLMMETSWKRKIREMIGARKLRKYLRGIGKHVESKRV